MDHRSDRYWLQWTTRPLLPTITPNTKRHHASISLVPLWLHGRSSAAAATKSLHEGRQHARICEAMLVRVDLLMARAADNIVNVGN